MEAAKTCVLGLALGALLVSAGAAAGQPPSFAAAPTAATDAAAAKALRPFLAVYRRGPSWLAGVDVFRQPSMREHVAHHEALKDRLLAAGPVKSTDPQLVGVIVVLAADSAAAEQWLANDPGVRSGVLQASIGEWRLSQIQHYRRAK